jgi:hypothetical protein
MAESQANQKAVEILPVMTSSWRFFKIEICLIRSSRLAMTIIDDLEQSVA